MENIKLDFEQAKAKHLLFKSRLRSILYGEIIDETPVLSHFECAVGKWIYGYALKTYGWIPEMHELEKVHEDIHTSAKQLVKLYKTGNIEEARGGLADMEKIADHLVGLFTILENKLNTEITGEDYDVSGNVAEVNQKLLTDLLIANEKLDKAIKDQTGKVLKERQLLHNFFMQAPAILAILKGRDHVFELANPAYYEFVGKRELIGITVKEAFPELENTSFFELLDNVFKTGETYIGLETLLPISKNGGETEHFYIDFSYQAIKNAGGITEGIMVFANDVTEKVKARKIIEDFANALEHKVAERTLELKHSEKILAFKNEELERQNAELASFTFIASHDLKEPLRKIEMYANKITEADGQNLSDKSKVNLDKLFDTVQRMQKLLGSIYNYAETGKESSFENTDLTEMVELSLQTLQEQIKEKDAIITFGALPVIKAIPWQIEQLFTNLIGNSIKYAKKNIQPEICINCEVKDDFNAITLKDNGIGFDENYKEKIFEIFQRLHSKSEYSGTGIGLAICKKIVSNHHGSIAAKSEGTGAEFIISLPFNLNLP
jgi:signal transduction histidine kinase